MANGNGLASVNHVVVLMLENRSLATNDQLYGSNDGPASTGQAATCQGFVANFGYTLGWQSKESGQWSIVPGTVEGDIMGCFTPEALPVLSALAKGYAVCDQWFASAPTETLPNRAFACAATSQGHMDDKTHTFTSPTIFGLLDAAGLGWAVRLPGRAADQGHVHPDQHGRRHPFRQVHRLPGRRRGRRPAALHVPGAELGRVGQQPAPQLQRGPGRAAHP
jgi:phospholipase C